MRLLKCFPLLTAVFAGFAAADPGTVRSFAIYPKRDYVTWPENQDAIEEMSRKLQSMAHESHYGSFYESKSQRLGTIFWAVSLTKEEKEAFWDEHSDDLLSWSDLTQTRSKQFFGLDAIVPANDIQHRYPDNSTDHPKQDCSAATFIEARGESTGEKLVSIDRCVPEDFEPISVPPGVVPRIGKQPYYHDDSLGQNAVVYVLDTGAELSHPEFSEALKNNQIRGWIFAGPNSAIHGDPDDLKTDIDVGFHGTAVLSKIIGKTLGVARKAHVVIVRVMDKHGYATNENCIDAVVQTYDHIYDKYRMGGVPIIINMSWSLKTDMGSEGYPETMKKVTKYLMDKLIEIDHVVPVTTAGNRKGAISDPLALHGEGMEKLVVVGGVDILGRNAQRWAKWLRVFAPSQEIEVAGQSDEDPWKNWMSGTSFAAPVVSAILAYLMTLGHTREELLKSPYKWTYPRIEGDDAPPVAWNLVTKEQIDAAEAAAAIA